jgi:hypothetical protein
MMEQAWISGVPFGALLTLMLFNSYTLGKLQAWSDRHPPVDRPHERLR